MRAAHFGRLHALKVTSPSVLLRCYGLYKQAVYGNCNEDSERQAGVHRKEKRKITVAQSLMATFQTFDPMRGPKYDAWKSEAGKSKEQAM